MAVGTFVVESQIDFLLQQTMELWKAGRQDKVIKKSGKGGVEQWEETITMSNQCAKVGLLNTALRLAQAKAKLAGVDISGRTQREMAFAEERQRQESWVRDQESGFRENRTTRTERPAKKPLIKKTEKSAVEASTAQPQVPTGKEDKQRDEREEFIKNTTCKQLINHLRSDPGCAGWMDEHFQEYAQRVWDAGPLEGDTAEAAELVPQNSAVAGGREEFSRRKPLPTPSFPASPQPAGPHTGHLLVGEGEESSLPSADAITFSNVNRGKIRKRREMQRRRDKRHSPQDRRRELLAPLATG
ncbi:MAG: hypothetical protein IAF94_13815, partial [Pirellulaceae bacterium]|nr:hypothetical protein [Pirellulaceae bacterium]